MQLIYSTIAFTLLNAVAAAPQAGEHPSNTITSVSGRPTTSSSSAAVTETGVFTIPNAGAYDVTYVSGAYDVAGHTLVPGGGDALVGGVVVTAASDAFLANGITVEFATLTVSTSSGAGTTVTSTASGTSSAVNVGTPSASASATSSAGAAKAMVTGGAGAVVLGGVLGLLVL